MNTCENCEKEFFYKHDGTMRKALCGACAVSRSRKNRKKFLVEYCGGECVLCGYSKSTEALDFHHVDPSIKDFGISDRGITRSLKKSLDEIEKCVLLCSNCHREVHAGLVILYRDETVAVPVC